MKKIEGYEIENLKEVLNYWRGLSDNPEEASYMIDHCHNNVDMMEETIDKLEAQLNQQGEINE